MTQLTDRQIAEHVVAGGFVGEDRVIGVAVVLAESGGRTDAIGDVTLETEKWGPSVGLFQIRSLKAERGTGRRRDELANMNPATNARHAHEVFSLEAGSQWTPWSTFNERMHIPFMDRAQRAVAAVAAGTPVESSSQPQLGDRTVYVVQSGDTLSGIAHSHGVTLAHIRELNPNLFNPAHRGGALVHPGERVVLSLRVSSTHDTYVVQSGDTLSGIARSHGVTLAHIRELNPNLFNPAHRGGALVHPGERVRL